MSEQVCGRVGQSHTLPSLLHYLFCPSLMCVCVCACVCVQLTVARDQATHAELKLYDVALEMHEKMTNQRNQLTSHFEVHERSRQLKCATVTITPCVSSSVCVLGTPSGWRS